jgi:hypothetical protein
MEIDREKSGYYRTKDFAVTKSDISYNGYL